MYSVSWLHLSTLISDLNSFWKQVAQRATIAHLSPMCQGQISFQKTYKWAMETRGSKSNSSELLCLSWLPATLMTIWSKMNELACRHHFPIISLWEIFRQARKGGDIIFPIISQQGLSVAMETRVLIQSAPKPYALFPPPQWCYT